MKFISGVLSWPAGQQDASDRIPADCCVFDDVAAIEQDLIDTYSINLSGTYMTNAKNPIAAAIPQVVHSRYHYFDPVEVLNDKLADQPKLNSRVLNRMGWRIDAAVISQARAVLFARYKEADHSIDDPFNNFCQSVSEDLSHDSLYGDGGDEAVIELVTLMGLRPQWHDTAERAAHADDKDYNPKSLHDMMVDEKPQQISIGARMNLEIIAAKEARGDEAKRQRLMVDFQARDAIQASERVTSNKRIMGTLLTILGTVERYVPLNAQFEHLSLRTQRSLTTFSNSTIENVLSNDIAKMRSVPVTEFSRICDCAYAAMDVLKEVLTGKLSEAGEMENIASRASIDHQREQKRRALLPDAVLATMPISSMAGEQPVIAEAVKVARRAKASAGKAATKRTAEAA